MKTTSAAQPKTTTEISFTIVCPKCKSEIALTEAMTHHVQEQLEADFQRRQQMLEKSMEDREKALSEQQAILGKARLEIDNKVAEKVLAERSKISATAMAEAKLN